MSIFLWNSEPSKIFVWSSEVASVRAGDTKVRPVNRYKTFTISRTEQSNMSSWWTYSDDAAWLTAGSTDFDEFFWYSVVSLKNDWTEYYEYTQTQSWGYWKLSVTSVWNTYNVMIKFPVRWIKMTKSWSIVTLSITDWLGRESEWYQYYAFTKWNTVKDNLYLWAYKMSSGYVSKSSKALLTWETRAEVRNWIISTYWNWTWYSQITWYPRQYVNALYMMKYWNPKCRDVVWKWYSNSSNRYPTNTFSTYYTTDATFWGGDTTQVRLFWLEDLWGNAYEWIDWCYLDSSKNVTVDKTNSVFQDSDYATNLGTSVLWYIWGIDGSSDGMFLSKTSQWNSNSYYCSTSWLSYSSNVIKTWGCYKDDWVANIFYMDIWGFSDYSKRDYWSRLMYL